jgi:hypothetical protein
LFTKNAQDWKEVEKIKSHPNITMSASFSLEEHIKMMKHGATSNREIGKENKEEEERLKVEKE